MRALLMVLTAFLVTATTAQAQLLTAGKVRLETDQRDGQGNLIYVMILEGTIAYPLDVEVEELFKKMTEPRGLLINLNSPGGSMPRGEKIISLIKKEIANGRWVATSVENGQVCASMCVPIFVQGIKRYAGEVSAFMFHGAYRPGVSNVPDGIQTEITLNIFRNSEVNKDWLNELIATKAFSLPGAYWISGKELFDQKSNIPTQLLPRHQIEKPWYAPIDPNIRSR